MSGRICVMLDPASTDYCVVAHGDLTDDVFTEATPTQGARFIGEMNAVGNGDGTITVTNLGRNSVELHEIAWAMFVDGDFGPHGTDEPSTVDSLNAVFHRVGAGGVAPTITSSNTINATVGEALSYYIEATENPYLFVASGLPSGILLNATTGQIIGTAPSTGTYPITVAAANSFGSDSLAINIITSGVFVNALSTIFVKKHSNYSEGTAPVPAPNTAWTHSFWFYTKKSGAILFAGDTVTEEGVTVATNATGNKLEVVLGDTTETSDYIKWESANNVWANETWHHAVVQHDGTLPFDANDITVYVDGTDVTAGGSTSGAGSYTSTAWDGTTDRIRVANGPAGLLDAHIDEVSSWDKVLSGVEVAALRSAGLPADLSGHAAFGASCDLWVRCGDGDTFPTWTDHTSNSNDMTMLNMTSGAFSSNVPQ